MSVSAVTSSNDFLHVQSPLKARTQEMRQADLASKTTRKIADIAGRQAGGSGIDAAGVQNAAGRDQKSGSFINVYA